MNHIRANFMLIFIWLFTQYSAPIDRPTPIFNQCDPDQVGSLQQALQAARTMTFNALLALNRIPESSRESFARYREWFGSFDLTNYTRVTDTYQRIYDALATKTITFSCNRSDMWMSYVHPDRPYEIFLASLYWKAPVRGTNSRAGALIHEVSHFVAVAGTQDITYGQILVRMTARYNPINAIKNADSYEYFAENDPCFPK